MSELFQFPLISYSNTYNNGVLVAPDDLSVQFAWGDQPNSVNFWTSIGGKTAFPATMLVQGSDTNINGNFVAQGNGGFNFGNYSGQLLSIVDPGTNAACDAWPLLQASSNGVAVTYTAQTSPGITNLEVFLTGVGNFGVGAGIFLNVKGTNSFAAGRYCAATGYASVSTGNATVANGIYSHGAGTYGFDNTVTKRFYCAGVIGNNAGTSQLSEMCLSGQTVGANAVVLTTGGNIANGVTNTSIVSQYTQLCPLYNSVNYSKINVVALDTTNTANRAYWNDIKVGYYKGNTATSIAIDYSANTGAPTTYVGTGNTWTITLSTDTLHGAVAVTFTGAGTDTYRIMARVDSTEVAAG